MLKQITQDWQVNAGTPRIQVMLAFFRLAQVVRARLGRQNPVSMVVALAYRLCSECLGNFEIPVSTEIGPGFTVFHGFGLVINPDSKIGKEVSVRHGVTIGNNGRSAACPTIGDGVRIGVGATILGGISVGAGASIGAHALVVSDVPPGARVRTAPSVVHPAD